MDTLTKITSLDRRWIFLLVAVAVIIPQLFPFSQPMGTTPPVEAVFNYIEGLPERSSIFICLDYDPSSEAELFPMTLALFRHCNEKNLRLLSATFWPTGRGLINRAFNIMEDEYEITHGVDYANYGYQVGGSLVIIQAGQDFAAGFPKAKTLRTVDMEVTEDIKQLADIDYFVDLAAGQTLDGWWVAYGVEWYGITLGGGCTAVSATQYYPYLNTGQINGLIGGLKGVAEYEILVDLKYGNESNPRRKIGQDGKTFLALGAAGMGSQSIVHILIILLVLFNNLIYFLSRKKTGGAA